MPVAWVPSPNDQVMVAGPKGMTDPASEKVIACDRVVGSHPDSAVHPDWGCGGRQRGPPWDGYPLTPADLRS